MARTEKYFAMPAAPASCGKSRTPCAGFEPITSMSIRFTGPTHWLRSKRPPRRCTRYYNQGKIRAIGVSNFSVGQMDRFRRVAPLHVLQPPYNLFERGIEADLLPYCRENKIAMFGYGALCRGLLSGRMRRIRLSVATIFAAPTQICRAAVRTIFVRRAKARSTGAATLRQARYPPGDPLDA